LLPPPQAHASRIFLVTPRIADEAAAAQLVVQLDDAAAAADIAAVLLRCRGDADDSLVRAAAAALHPVIQRRDIALLLDGRADLVAPSRADGVHLMQAADYGRARRHVVDGIVGVGCRSRDDAMNVAEAGADYVLFGDYDDPAPTAATLALVEWWAALMTVPCVAGGSARASDHAALVSAGADFVAVADHGWSHAAGLRAYLQTVAPSAPLISH